MSRSTCAGVLAVMILSGCSTPTAVPATPNPATQAPSPTGSPTAEPSPSAAPTAASSPKATPGADVPRVEIALDPAPIPITQTLTLQVPPPPLDDEAERAVRDGVQDYLMRLDWYRREMNGDVPLTGRFAQAVKAGIDASRTPGVERTFVLESLKIERYLLKPWGVPALAEASVTIVDRATGGTAPDQRETGRLRMFGDRLFVVDGWDERNQRWFNDDIEVMTEARLRGLAVQPLEWYLRVESWVPGSPAAGSSSSDDPFALARSAYLNGLDRSKVSRTLVGVKAQIEKYETFAEISHGLATLRLTGTVVTVDRSGREERQNFDRRLLVLIGNWSAEVVDEEVSPGVWMTGGKLLATLKERDRNFA